MAAATDHPVPGREPARRPEGHPAGAAIMDVDLSLYTGHAQPRPTDEPVALPTATAETASGQAVAR